MSSNDFPKIEAKQVGQGWYGISCPHCKLLISAAIKTTAEHHMVEHLKGCWL